MDVINLKQIYLNRLFKGSRLLSKSKGTFHALYTDKLAAYSSKRWNDSKANINIYIYIYVFIEVIADLSIVQDIKYTIKHNTYKIYNKTYTCTSNTSL